VQTVLLEINNDLFAARESIKNLGVSPGSVALDDGAVALPSSSNNAFKRMQGQLKSLFAKKSKTDNAQQPQNPANQTQGDPDEDDPFQLKSLFDNKPKTESAQQPQQPQKPANQTQGDPDEYDPFK
jgi:hypothetical protein